MVKKVSIITRAYNRLEYTIKCINSVRDKTKYPYEHIIVDNGSSDGTGDWLRWVTTKIDWFPNVVPVHLKRNKGDWGGLIEGSKFVSKDSGYIVQLDNDIVVSAQFASDSCWLTEMVGLLQKIPEGILQLHRVGPRHRCPMVKPPVFRTVDGYLLDAIYRPVACFILTMDDWKRAIKVIDNNSGKYGRTELGGFLGVMRVRGFSCYMIDGADENGYINHEKYPRNSPEVHQKN